MGIENEIDGMISYIASGTRLFAGIYVDDLSRADIHRPPKPLKLYDIENDTACRLVRDALTMLGLQAIIYPVPEGGSRFRRQLNEESGSYQVPFLVDENTGKKISNSGDWKEIVEYLYGNYGSRSVPPQFLPGLAEVTSGLAGLLRGNRGRKAGHSGKAPEKPLILYSFEESPWCRLVRERLCELEIPYHLFNVGKAPGMGLSPLPDNDPGRTEVDAQKTAMRRDFVEKSGQMQVPYLIDPNTGKRLFESEQINRYLTETYGS